MYELMFGITGAPFRLTPDPAFYFDAETHRSALETLRSGIWQRSGFTVLTGEIGAGKTTLLHTLTAELVADGQVVGAIFSTQLDANEILRAAAHAFGVPVGEGSTEATAKALFDFFAGLGGDGKRAILTVDEAHNLSPQALLQLVRLSTAASTQRVPLHVFLVGQTELRALVDSPALAPLKAQVRSRFHLGPLAADEVRSYVEHRLRRVNWQNTPSFDADAFDEIFRWTDGVPRRINLLCNRLLLSRFLDASSHVSVATVVESAQALKDEMDGPDSASGAMVDLMTSTSTHRDGEPSGFGSLAEAPVEDPAEAPVDSADAGSTAARRAEPLGADAVDAAPAGAPRPVLCVVTDADDFVDAAALIGAMARGPENPPPILTRIFRRAKEEHTVAAFGSQAAPPAALDLDLGSSPVRVHGGELRRRFIATCAEVRPSAVVVFRPTEASLVCAIVARQRRIPVIGVGPAARERRRQAWRDEIAKRLWTALQGSGEASP